MSGPWPGAIGVVLRGRPWWRHLVDTLIAWGSRSQAVHAFVVVRGGMIVEAQPAGARLGRLAEYPQAVFSTWALDDVQADAIVRAAQALLGTPYNWWDDLALGMTRRFGVHVPGWVRRRLADPGFLQCAQLVDMAYQDAGIALFDDDRLDGDVTPGDLLMLIGSFRERLP